VIVKFFLPGVKIFLLLVFAGRRQGRGAEQYVLKMDEQFVRGKKSSLDELLNLQGVTVHEGGGSVPENKGIAAFSIGKHELELT